MNTVTLCAIARDESDYLLEWIAYNRLLGFDNIIVYNNDSKDNSDQILDALHEAGILSHIRWPTHPTISPQTSAYQDAVTRCATEWIAFFDLDEFLVLREDLNIHAFLDRFPDASAVAINWSIFGSSGHQCKEPGLVIDRFLQAAPPNFSTNRHCKTIARCTSIAEPRVHRCILSSGSYVDTLGRPIEIEREGFTPSIQHGVAKLNHYVLKSKEEFQHKKMRGNANRGSDTPNRYSTREGQYFQMYDRNDVVDKSITLHSPAIYEEIEYLTSAGKIKL